MSEYHLNLDPYNFNSEWEQELFDGIYTIEYIQELYADNKISQEEYEYAMDYLSEIA